MKQSNQVGITETGEVAFNLDIFDNLKKANIIITKRLTNKLIDKLILHKNKCILHFSVTGMGGSVLEPSVPTLDISEKYFSMLLDNGFPIEQVVLRIDPIIPTDKGIKTALDVIKRFNKYDIQRIRWSSLDMYKHVKDRFIECGISIPYETFHAPIEMINKLSIILDSIAYVNEIKLESCGEPNLISTPCISQIDLDILKSDIILDGQKGQRTNCTCPSNKTQLIKSKPSRCSNNCLYCFWKNE